jgi:hypothetical protein
VNSKFRIEQSALLPGSWTFSVRLSNGDSAGGTGYGSRASALRAAQKALVRNEHDIEIQKIERARNDRQRAKAAKKEETK